jgi:hypothetical protein
LLMITLLWRLSVSLGRGSCKLLVFIPNKLPRSQ